MIKIFVFIIVGLLIGLALGAEGLDWMIYLVVPILATLLGPLLVKHYEKRHDIEEKVKRLVSELGRPFQVEKWEIERDLLVIGKPAIKPLRRCLRTAEPWIKAEIEVIMYKLGDKKSKVDLDFELGKLLSGSRNYEDITKALDLVEDLKIVKLAPALFNRLKQEKDEGIAYGIIRTLGELVYEPALPYLLNRAESAEEKLTHAYYISISNIARQKLNALSLKTYNKIMELFAGWLEDKDEWLMDGVVRVSLYFLTARKDDLNESIRTKLIQALSRLLLHKRSEFRTNAIDRLVELEAGEAVPFLRERLEKETDDSMKRRFVRALKILSPS